ncbi:MAG: hypothetical protein ACI4V4_04200 [Eubacterium sp.]
MERRRMMMKFTDSRALSFWRMICAFTVGFFVLFSFSSTAFAYDDGYVGDSKYWNDKGEIVDISNSNFNGCLKYVIDEESCCMYFYLSFYDSLMTESSSDCCLSFNVKNSKNDYLIALGKNGVISDNQSSIEKNFNVYYDFSKVKPKYHGGEIFAAIEFKNSDDKNVENIVSCEYSCGKNNNFYVKDGIVVNMVKTTVITTTEKTTKQTTEKTTKSTTEITTKLTTEKAEASETTSAKTTKATTSTTNKTTSTTTEKTTKFVPSTTNKNSSSVEKTSTQSATKFSAEKNNSGNVSVGSNESTDVLDESGTFLPEDLQNIDSDKSSAVSEEISTSEGDRTNDSKVLFVFGIAVFVIGVCLILYGTLNGKYKIVKNDGLKENTETSEKDNES